MTEAEQQELERITRLEFGHRRNLANLCTAVMVRVVELEDLAAAGTTPEVIAKKLRAGGLAAT